MESGQRVSDVIGRPQVERSRHPGYFSQYLGSRNAYFGAFSGQFAYFASAL